MKVKFIDVGRDKKTWEAECDTLTYDWMYSQVKKALMSNNIEFGEDGKIYAGFRAVGRFGIIEEDEK